MPSARAAHHPGAVFAFRIKSAAVSAGMMADRVVLALRTQGMRDDCHEPRHREARGHDDALVLDCRGLVAGTRGTAILSRRNAIRRPNLRTIADFVSVAAAWAQMVSMKIAAGMFSMIITATFGTLMPATKVAAQPTETIRFAIMRNGEQIGTHAIEISRNGPETDVRITTELAVKVLFVTAYRLQNSATERWMNGQLVALDSTTDNNGVQHKVSATRGGSGLEVKADGKTSHVDQNVFPASLWNPELMRRRAALDIQDGQVDPISVTDDGSEDLTLGARVLKAHHYEMKGRYSQDIWYDERGHLVQVKLIGSDGSEISYKPM